jgi:hypothetical protein
MEGVYKVAIFIIRKPSFVNSGSRNFKILIVYIRTFELCIRSVLLF